MKPDRWNVVQRVFLSALDLNEDDREAYLDRECAGDADLRAEVESLIDVHLDDPDFLQTPIGDFSTLDPAGNVDATATRMIGPYEVVRPLGEGGMGEVFLATQRTDAFTRAVAIKVVKRGMDTDEVLRRFALERRILASLAHPNIAQLQDAGATNDGRPYFVMEFMDGDRIDAYSDRVGLTVEGRLGLFQTACAAVQHAHRNLVVHRDIKPSNVLVSADGVVKLVDFGIGTVLSGPEGAHDGRTRTSARRLTPDYASPEQLRGETVTTAADVFALGVLLFELLAGDRPWPRSESDDATRVQRMTTTATPRPSDVVAGSERLDAAERTRRARHLRGDLDNIVLRAIHPEPDRRYSSAAAISEDIDRYLEGRPVLARGDSVAYRASKFVRRNRWLVATAAAVVVGLIGVTATTSIQSRRVVRERDKAREVQSFLLETFGASTADGPAGDSTTVRQLLAGQAASVRTTYSEDPELLAEMLTVLADAYERLGLHGDAEPLARESLAIRSELWSADHADVASTTTLLGWIRHQQGASEEAVELLDESVSMWRRLGRGDEEGLARALNDLGSVYDQLGRTDEAEALLREALVLRRAHAGPLDRAVAVTSSNLATLMYRRGDYVAADSLGRAAVEALRASVGPDHQRTFVAQSNLATFRWVAGDLDGAAELYEELLAEQYELGGGRNRRTASAMVTYASLLRARGESDAAERLLTDALDIQEEILDPDHRDIGNTTRVLGILLLQSGRAEASVPYLERALAVNRSAYGDAHRQVGESLVGLANAHGVLGRTDRAVQEYRDGIAILDSALGEAHPRSVDERVRLGAFLLRTGAPAEAAEVFAAAHRGVASRDEPDDADLLSSRNWLARALLEAGETARADSLLAVSEAAPAQEAPEDEILRMTTLRARIDSIR